MLVGFAAAQGDCVADKFPLGLNGEDNPDLQPPETQISS